MKNSAVCIFIKLQTHTSKHYKVKSHKTVNQKKRFLY